ncbi:SDR family NAD(P)-dependent oxidoreductase [Mycolicibacterium sp. 624]|uniref:SDR family oxidoreductase n=1 Tax=Mycolicibacterium sp. 624 TaxID=3156314 RepID=UPI00339A1503
MLSSAGIILNFGKLADITPRQWRTVIDTNLTGVFNVCRAVLPQVVGQRKGSIVVTTSTAGRFAYANISDYGVSK